MDPRHARCARCDDRSYSWDRIGGVCLCHSCLLEYATATGRAEDPDALILRTQAGSCLACDYPRVVTWMTVPAVPGGRKVGTLVARLCPAHLRQVIQRRLSVHAYGRLRAWVRGLGYEPNQVYLLCSLYYTVDGQAVQPLYRGGER